MIAAQPTTIRLRTRAPRTQQRGAALIVGLILMLALTVLGISGMNMATLELTMANNSQAQQLAFQRAETGIDQAITIPANPGSPPDFGTSADDIQVTTTFEGNTLVPDGSGWSTDVTAYHFDIVSVGRGPRNAVSTHNQSFYVIGPATN